MNKRIIKNENIKNFKNVLNPEPLQLNKTNNPVCLTKFNYDNNKLNNNNNYKCNIESNDNYKKNLYIPPLGISTADILKIYNINSIDSLNDWITDNFETFNLFTLNRVINCWIRNNLDVLKISNNALESIYSKLIQKQFSTSYLEKLEQNNINKEIKDFIDYWIEKNNNIDFHFNLFEDLCNYIVKKFK